MQPNLIAGFFDILGKAQKAYTRQLEPVCKKWDLTRSELDVLLFLYNNPGFDRAADIVSRRGMTKSHVSLSVNNLADRELLCRQDSSVDRRTAHLKLSPAGEEIAAEARAAQKAFFAMLYEGVPAETLDLWQEITQKVCENIESFNKTSTNL